MRRFLATSLVLIVIAVLVYVAVGLADDPGTVALGWGGFHANPTIGQLVLAVVAMAAAGALLWRLVRAVLGAPAALGRARRERRRREGYRALTQGMVAVAAGEAGEARRLARKADVLLAEPPLTLLLQAQAAQLDGDEHAARDYFTAMLGRRETEFLGLRGLLTQALKAGDDATALGLAERAQRLRPKTGWALASLVELQARAGQFPAAEATLAQAVKRAALPPPESRRMRAALLLEQSHAAASTGQPRAALALADRAQDADGSLAPAAAWHATLLRDAGRIRQAGRALERAWRVAPQPALAEVYRTLWPDEPPLLRVKRFERLAEANPDHSETRLVMARVALEAKLWGETRRHLVALGAGEDGNSPTARVCRLMAELEEAERGDGTRARSWLQRAATTTALDPTYVCSKCGAESERWIAICPHCRAFGSLDWRAPARALAAAGSLPGSPTAPALPPADTSKDTAALPPRRPPDKDRSRLALR